MTRLAASAAVVLALSACGGRASTTAAARPQEAIAPARNEAIDRSGRILGRDAEGCTWVLGESTVRLGGQDTPDQTRAAAIEQARAAAVQDLLGTDLRSRFMDFQQEGLRRDAHLTESVLQTTRNGRILKEEILEKGLAAAADGGTAYRVRLKDCVATLPAGADKDFRVRLELNRARFVQGDEAKIVVTPTEDAWVYLYSVYDLDAQPKTALVVPGDAGAARRVKAGERWEFPDPDAAARGVKLVARLPRDGDDASAETVRVVISKRPLPPSIYEPADGGWFGVVRRLTRDGADWADDAEAYTIYRK